MKEYRKITLFRFDSFYHRAELVRKIFANGRIGYYFYLFSDADGEGEIYIGGNYEDAKAYYVMGLNRLICRPDSRIYEIENLLTPYQRTNTKEKSDG